MLTALAWIVMNGLPYQNPELPVDARIDDLLSRMTLNEKIDCLGTNPSVPRLGVKGSNHLEGLHGVSMGGPANWAPRNPIPTTIFPQSYGLGETWDTDLIRKVGAVEGFEARYIFQNRSYRQGAVIIRTPNADLGRDPRWGRTEECFGEDPVLTGSLVVAFVKGLQGDDPKYWQAASLLKHFLANSNEDTRDTSSSDFDERLWREYYSVPFRMGVMEGGARAYMAAYNAYNCVPCHVNPMHKEITIKEWGQDGFICTDGGGMSLLVSARKLYKTPAEACAAVVKAGIGQFLDWYREPVREAVKKEMLTEADIDAVLRGSFRVMIKLGLLDPPEQVPYSSIGQGPKPWESAENKALARLVTAKSVVLLKNDGLLPLNAKKLRRVAVVGRLANEVLLDWYSGTPPYRVSIVEGIRAKLGPDVQVISLPEPDESIRSVDVVVAVAGSEPVGDAGWAKADKPSYGKEALDRQSIDLEDEAMVQRTFAINPKTVLVLKSSFPYAINWSQKQLPAIVHLTHGSQEEGNGLADVLFGDVNPAGRLSQTWPASLDQLPPLLDYNLRHGRTYLYSKAKPLYPFGYGLSYSRFGYGNLRVTRNAEGYDVAVRIDNTGKRDGEEVAQVYVRFIGSKVERPIKQLVGFQRVAIAAGGSREVAIHVPADRLAYWDAQGHRWVNEACGVEFLVGGSSQDIRVRKKA